MELRFFDTSALVKRYYEEDGTETVDRLVESDGSTVISTLSIIEAASAFRRKHNRGAISESEMNDLLGAFFEEALDDFVILPMEESLLQFSFDLVLEDDLRTLDSLQLSAALSIESGDDTLTFVCADADLVATAEGHSLNAINPEQ